MLVGQLEHPQYSAIENNASSDIVFAEANDSRDLGVKPVWMEFV